MTPYYERDGITIYVGDNREVLPALDVTVSAVVTDPPYGLSFMGKDWDHSVPGEAFWRIIAGAMKPGAHLLSFGGSRTFHRIGVAIEDAGLELRDTLMWLYGSGFPKSHDVSKAIDKAAGAEREVVGSYKVTRDLARNGRTGDEAISPVPVTGTTLDVTAPATPEAAQWAGWGTALKPAHEPIILARKRLSGTVAANVLAHGTGALNIDASRIGTEEIQSSGWTGMDARRHRHGTRPKDYTEGKTPQPSTHTGRWPANVILDEAAAQALDRQSGERKSGSGAIRKTAPGLFGMGGDGKANVEYGDTGGASRFFYVAKASRKERNAGLDGMPERKHMAYDNPARVFNKRDGGKGNEEAYKPQANHHPTVKPLALMRYLITLITPPGGIVLDPFAGSGSTLVACAELGIPAIGIELSEEYAEIAARRIDHVLTKGAACVVQPSLLEGVAD